MSAALLEDLRQSGVRLEVNGLMLHIDAPEEAVTDRLRETLRQHKSTLIRAIESERVRLEQAARRGLVIRWSKESGYIAIHDPTRGEWHEIAASGCPEWVVQEARSYTRREKERT